MTSVSYSTSLPSPVSLETLLEVTLDVLADESDEAEDVVSEDVVSEEVVLDEVMSEVMLELHAESGNRNTVSNINRFRVNFRFKAIIISPCLELLYSL